MRRLDSITNSMDMSLSKLWETEEDRSLVGHSPWGRKESEWLHFLSHTVMRCMGCDPAMSYRLGGHEWFFCNRQVHQVTILYTLERRMLYVLHEEHSISIHRDMKHITSPSFSIFQWRVCMGCAKRKEKKRKLYLGWGWGGWLRDCHAGTQISIKPRACSPGKSQGPRKLSLVRLSSQLRALRICCHAKKDRFLLPG